MAGNRGGLSDLTSCLNSHCCQVCETVLSHLCIDVRTLHGKIHGTSIKDCKVLLLAHCQGPDVLNLNTFLAKTLAFHTETSLLHQL